MLSTVRHGGASPAAKAATDATDAAVQGVWPTLQATAPAEGALLQSTVPVAARERWRKPGRRLATARARAVESATLGWDGSARDKAAAPNHP